MSTAYAARGFVHILARPPPKVQKQKGPKERGQSFTRLAPSLASFLGGGTVPAAGDLDSSAGGSTPSASTPFPLYTTSPPMRLSVSGLYVSRFPSAIFTAAAALAPSLTFRWL